MGGEGEGGSSKRRDFLHKHARLPVMPPKVDILTLMLISVTNPSLFLPLLVYVIRCLSRWEASCK